MEDNWFQKTAEEAELVLSDEDDSDDEKVRVFSQRRVFKNWVGPALVFLSEVGYSGMPYRILPDNPAISCRINPALHCLHFENSLGHAKTAYHVSDIIFFLSMTYMLKNDLNIFTFFKS